MTPNPTSPPPSPSRHHLADERWGDRVREGWFPHRAFEFGGRLYEWTGVRAFYVFMAKIAGEPVLPKLGQGATQLSPNAVREFRIEARFHEWANIVLLWTYLPGLVGGLILPNWPYFWLNFLMASVNVGCVLTERYKRAVCADLLARGATGDQELAKPQAPEKPLWDAYFVPKRWETVKLYERLGAERFRLMLLDGITACRFPPADRTSDAKFLANPGRDEILGFEATTRTAEIIHTTGLLLHLLMLGFFWRLDPVLTVYMVLLAVYDSYFVLLQRYHRARVWKLVERFRSRQGRRESPAGARGSLG